MKRIVTYVVSAVLGAALLGASGSASAQMAAPAYPYNYQYSYGYPNGYYSYNTGNAGNPFAWLAAPVGAAAAVPGAVVGAATAPLTGAPMMTGRSAAEIGRYCSTPAKTCRLIRDSWVGNGCSCRVPGGHERGSVTP